jgi:hypothetical protein
MINILIEVYYGAKVIWILSNTSVIHVFYGCLTRGKYLLENKYIIIWKYILLGIYWPTLMKKFNKGEAYL